MSIKTILSQGAAGVALLALSGHAMASNFSYSYLEGGLASTRFDQDVVVFGVAYSGVAGLYLGGSYQFTDHFALGVSVGGQSNSDYGTEINTSSGGLTGQFILPMGNTTDLSLGIGLVSAEAEVCFYNFCFKDDDSGVALGAGLRHWATSNLELNGSLTRVSWDAYDDTSSLGIGMGYWFTPHSSMRLAALFSDDDTSVTLGYRYSFAR